MNANDLQVIYEVFKLPDASGSSSDRVMSEVKVSGAKKQANVRIFTGRASTPLRPPHKSAWRPPNLCFVSGNPILMEHLDASKPTNRGLWGGGCPPSEN